MRPLLFILLAFFMIAADQASKWYTMEHILRPEAQRVAGIAEAPKPPSFTQWYQTEPKHLEPVVLQVLPNFNLVSVWNKGISFGLFNKATDYGPMILVGLSLVISVFFLVWLFRTDDIVQSIGILMVIGGALGNVIDRVRYGAVFDFLDFHLFDYHWPAFNIADSGIVLGVAVLILHSFFTEKPQGVAKHEQ